MRFTIRDVLWLTALVATACGWWFDHRAISKRAAKAESAEWFYSRAIDNAGYKADGSYIGPILIPRKAAAD